MASNPRIDDLRKRLEKDPGSRLFAQLAEELRKDGELEDAIRVSREGLQKHAAYPSARMTLGRALLDTGDLAAARAEFETVLKGAPDNILASRFLGECLEGLGDLAAARDRYRATLSLAPGDKQLTTRLQDVEAKLKKAPSAASSAATVVLRAPSEGAPVAPIPLSSVDEPMELERSHEAPRVAARPEPPPAPTILMAPPPPPAAAPPPAAEPKEPALEPPPIPLVAAEEDFELERPYEAPTAVMPPPPAIADAAAPASPPPAGPVGGADAPAPAEFEFDLGEGGSTGPVPEPWHPEPEPPVAPTIVSVSPATLPPMPAPRREPELVPEPVAPPLPPPTPVYDAEPPIPPPRPVVEAAPPPPRVEPPPPPPSPPQPVREAPPLAPPVEFVPPPVAPSAPEPIVAPAAPREVAPAPVVAAPPPVAAPPTPVATPPVPITAAAAPAAAPAPPPPADELTSSTLAELYFNQGFTDKAIEVYRQLLQREPGNERARTRLGELEALERSLKDEESRGIVAAGAAPVDPAAARRQAIERTIARLEGLMAALRKE